MEQACWLCGLEEDLWDWEPCPESNSGCHDAGQGGSGDDCPQFPSWHYNWVPEMGPYGGV